MTPKTHAYFLVSHGSRRPQSQQSLQQLARYFRMVLTRECTIVDDERASSWVASGCLEFQSMTLSEQLVQFYRALPSTVERVNVLPIFLLPGNHVREDIPEAIQLAQTTLHSAASTGEVPADPFVLHPHLGSHPQLKAILQAKMANHHPEAWILMGHGSRRSEGNVAIQQLASGLQALPAFWAVQPSLTTQVTALLDQGIRSIGVLPYFLFSGKITDAIAAQGEQLAQQYPDLTLRVCSPLRATPQLANALFDLSQSPSLAPAFQAKAM